MENGVPASGSGKVYNLGTFVDYEDAVKARLEAEKKYYDTFLEQYQNRTK